MTLRGILAYGFLVLFCGLLLLGATVGARELGVGTAGGVLALTAALALGGFARLAGRRLVWRLDWTTVASGAILAAVALAGSMLAMNRIGVALTAFVLGAVPVFASLGAQMRGRARLTGTTALGLGLGIVGLFLVAATPSGDASWRFIVGVLYALATAVVVGISGRWLSGRVEHERSVEHGVVSLVLAAAALFCVAPFAPPSGNPWWALVIAVLGLGCGLLLLVAMSAVAVSISARVTATLPAAGTVLAAVGGVLLLAEQVSAVEWVGAVLIVAGTALLSPPLVALLPPSWRR